jgi:hypothetical protein
MSLGSLTINYIVSPEEHWKFAEEEEWINSTKGDSIIRIRGFEYPSIEPEWM